MRRRTFLAALPASALASGALAQSRADNPNRDRPDVHGGDRIDGATFASRSAAWGAHGAAATAHPPSPSLNATSSIVARRSPRPGEKKEIASRRLVLPAPFGPVSTTAPAPLTSSAAP